MRKTLRQLMQESDRCIFAPCVYDCSSARAMEMAGYEALMFSSGEYSLAGSGVVDYGFSGLSDLEWMVGRITATCSLPLAVDIEDGFGGPLAVYRTCKRLARLGADPRDARLRRERRHHLGRRPRPFQGQLRHQ